MSQYENAYTEKSFWEKLKQFAKKAGVQVVYAALLLYYVLQKENLPLKVKGTILGALGYFISPIDAIPDAFFGVGYTDDFGVLMLALAIAASYIDQEVKERARTKLRDWFGDDIDDDIEEVEAKIK